MFAWAACVLYLLGVLVPLAEVAQVYFDYGFVLIDSCVLGFGWCF